MGRGLLPGVWSLFRPGLPSEQELPGRRLLRLGSGVWDSPRGHESTCEGARFLVSNVGSLKDWTNAVFRGCAGLCVVHVPRGVCVPECLWQCSRPSAPELQGVGASAERLLCLVTVFSQRRFESTA